MSTLFVDSSNERSSHDQEGFTQEMSKARRKLGSTKSISFLEPIV